MTMKIRIGNDFVFNWAIERGGLPEDLSSVLEKHLHLSVFGKRVELIEGVDYDITGNVIRIEVTPAIANIIGTYKVEFHYILPDNGLIDDDRKCAVDVDAFQIVAKTAQADDSTEFSMTSDMAIAFKGDKGDKGDSAYQVWLEEGNTGTEEDYFAFLRQPAIDAGASISELESEIQVNEGLRVQAESERDSAEETRIQSESERLAAETIRQSNEGNRIENEATRGQNEAERISEENVRQSNEVNRVEAEGIRQSNETDRVSAENLRESAESDRVELYNDMLQLKTDTTTAKNDANDAAQSANEAADSALTATQEATTAASLADTARLAIQDDLALKANQTDLEQLAGDVNLKELKANKQNSLAADGTGAKFPTVDAVNEGLQPKLVSGTNIKTVNGKSLLGSGDVSNLIATYTHTTNTVIQPTALDPVTGIFTCNNHGLTQNKVLSWNMNRNHNLLPYQVIPIEINGGRYGEYYADVIDANSFKIKKTSTDAPLTYASAGDITKWHFETNAVSLATITNLPAYKKIKVITKFISNQNAWFQLYPTNVGGDKNNWYTDGAIIDAYSSTLNSFGRNMPAYVESYFDFGEISTIRHKLYGFTHVHTSPTTVTRVEPLDLCWINFDNLGALEITDLRIGSPTRRLLNGTTVEIYKI